MTPAEKEEACKRICGDSATRGIHFHPCPILDDLWKGKKPVKVVKTG